MSPIATNLHSLRGRLTAFFAALIAAILILHTVSLYLTAVALEDEEAEPQADKDRELARVRRFLLGSLGLGIPLGGALALLGSVWMTRRTLRSLTGVVQAASALSPEHLDQRFPTSPSDDAELQPLLTTLNHMLSRLDRAVSGLRRFTHDAAHELRTPLSALHARIEIALRHPRDATTLRTTLEESLEDLADLQALVEALLLLSRTDAGELPVRAQAVPLSPLLQDLASLYSGVVGERSLDLSIDCPAALSLVTDKLLLGRALANLIDNACKFSPPGGQIYVGVRRQPPHIVITLRDQGPGIPPAELGRVGERFFRGAAHRGDTPGYGLGLALTHEFVAALGGCLTLDSQPGRGTEVRLQLPEILK